MPVWYPYKAKYLDLSENVQRRATKQLPGFRNLTYEERLQRLKLPTLAYRRARGDMIEVFKIVHNVYDRTTTVFLKLTIDFVTRQPGRGQDLQLHQRRSQRNLRKHFFSLRVAQIWNSLPLCVMGAQSVATFKCLDKHLGMSYHIIYHIIFSVWQTHSLLTALDSRLCCKCMQCGCGGGFLFCAACVEFIRRPT